MIEALASTRRRRRFFNLPKSWIHLQLFGLFQCQSTHTGLLGSEGVVAKNSQNVMNSTKNPKLFGHVVCFLMQVRQDLINNNTVRFLQEINVHDECLIIGINIRVIMIE